MTTIQEMIETAMEEGAAVSQLWYVGNEPTLLKFTDDGFWYFVDTKDHRIDEDDAHRLLDCYQIGYID